MNNEQLKERTAQLAKQLPPDKANALRQLVKDAAALGYQEGYKEANRGQLPFGDDIEKEREQSDLLVKYAESKRLLEKLMEHTQLHACPFCDASGWDAYWKHDCEICEGTGFSKTD